MSEQARWQGRYSTPDYLFGKAPNYFLASCKALLPKSGKALAVADGEARNGVWLAEQGLDVVSIDFSEAAQAKAAALAKERGVAIKLVHTDVHAWDLSAGCVRRRGGNLHPIQYAGRTPAQMGRHA